MLTGAGKGAVNFAHLEIRFLRFSLLFFFRWLLRSSVMMAREDEEMRPASSSFMGDFIFGFLLGLDQRDVWTGPALGSTALRPPAAIVRHRTLTLISMHAPHPA